LSAVFVDADLVVASHEAAHATAALLEGMHVVSVTIDRSLIFDAGQCHYRFLENDRRIAAIKAAADARVTLAGVLLESGEQGQCDSDRRSVLDRAEIARTPDVPGWIAMRVIETQAMLELDIFQRIVSEISYVLLEKRTLTAEAIAQSLKQVPGAITAVLSARESKAGISRASI
jgi:hypothetical protein